MYYYILFFFFFTLPISAFSLPIPPDYSTSSTAIISMMLTSQTKCFYKYVKMFQLTSQKLQNNILYQHMLNIFPNTFLNIFTKNIYYNTTKMKISYNIINNILLVISTQKQLIVIILLGSTFNKYVNLSLNIQNILMLQFQAKIILKISVIFQNNPPLKYGHIYTTYKLNIFIYSNNTTAPNLLFSFLNYAPLTPLKKNPNSEN
eukprot:TRINITY_DN2712_c0_g1_i3.p2 TRINITY_DN2712_c0_g1~~TRINITY_DN2712_c0_g1_i3.p2  ORF type:complete len:204 (+),score=-22.45 TRINITY_DN2712_c0_g1_i3:1-612(+)